MISLIGMGSGCPESLTVQGLAALQSAGLILGAKRLLEHLPVGCTDNHKAVYKPDEILACLAAQPDTDIDPSYTLGDMERQRQQTIAQLQQEGVWDMNREAPMPAVVQRVAIVSSANAAGYQDFCKELARSPYRFELTLFDAFMQGEAAEESIIEALCNVAARPEKFDAVVLIRGGGSRSDLNCFNAYRLCAHVAQFPLPVVTGIGHDKDTSVADMVAHTALKTPTAVEIGRAHV